MTPLLIAAAAWLAAGFAVQSEFDALGPRADEYWRRLVAGDRPGAAEFMREEVRLEFITNPEPPFLDPEVEAIELSDDATRAVASVNFDVITPFGEFRWEIDQHWTCVDGAWIAELRQASPFPFADASGAALEEPPPPADTGCMP